ncbi:hypothetical protein HETIRDRAFT_449607 [Heterobasidion irregulare TC 32-1]|uniref:DNA damage-inducible protein 1 n=1 Tax=Heterobasidion irregulare (strain TC 32-1) TaxID=747525 RepID=W4KDY3_HETIT|nr:uncharacterized protein HETIRDRAFT_449607 [Heterobasidion irregulare TC 32-1]ETW84018.1 hypothetical protein HETIRDRAFT_449607 [Heterobasidion irregulare TC 32-1]
MELTFVNDFGQSFVVEIDPNMELENVMALLEAESNIPAHEQSISFEGRELSNPKATMRELGVGDNAVLLLRRKVNIAGQPAAQDSEMMRLQLLGDPALMGQLRDTQPELAHAAQSNPARFAELLSQTNTRQMQADREIQRLNADPYDIDGQRRIEEAIRQQAVMENLEHALEYSPESFGRVTMLYIPVEVNSKPVKAFVDSGAQQTIIRNARKHVDVFLPCSFTIMEGRDVDLLLGLDMLKAHQACIDLEKNVLRIQGREVRFLAEHELPDKARMMDAGVPEPRPASPVPGPSTSGSRSPQPFPGAGSALGSAPASVATSNRDLSRTNSSRHSEEAIATLISLGATREVAISTLDAAGGNLDVAASLLF